MARRQKGTGSVRERRAGVFEIKLDVGAHPISGKRRTKYQTVKGTRREAERELRKLLRQVDTGDYVEPNKVTVTLLLDRWIDHMKPRVAPKTLERYEQLIENNIKPVLGAKKLEQLRPYHIEGAWTALLQEGRKDDKGGLAPQTVKHCHRLLRQALAQAVRWQLVGRNPADAVEPPRVAKKDLDVLDFEQTAALLRSIRETRYYLPALIAVTTGLRRGETLALRWKDISLEGGGLSVMQSLEQTKAGLRFKEPKNGRFRRVAMPSLLIDGLRRHKREQAEDLLKLGVRQSKDTLVCCGFDGEPMNPEDLSRRFPDAVVNAGLPRIVFHTLRHSHATQLLSGGTHPKVAQERLGHGSMSVTMDLYSHHVPGLQEEAAERVDSALRSALNSGSLSA